jgi:Ser/Thr protein kinase RdoA (MazF antagonist)
MHPCLLASACQLYATTPDLLIPLSGGHYNVVYKFPLQQTSLVSKTCEVSMYGVMRIGVQDCPPEQTLGMLEWARFLSEHGAPVTAPLPSTNHLLLEQLTHDDTCYIVTAFENAEGILAENIPPSEWTDDLFQGIGSAVGKFHRISLDYRPSRPALTRPMWFDSYEIHEATKLLATSSDPAREKLSCLVNELKQLPTSQSDFCLIHDDLHFANFLILPGGQVAIIDFDDCVIGFPVIDVAMALFDVLVLYNPTDEAEKQAFARCFLSNYLAGYRTESELPQYWLEQVPHFLKLKELCIYADLLGHADVDLPDSWVGRFMHGRSDRIAGDIPYVDIDFTNM